MRVAMYYNNNDLRIEEMPKPKIGKGEFLLKVIASGICGSDVMQWYRIKKAPLVLGHEVTGEIVAVGEGIENYKKGDRVFVSHHVPCNRCHYCLNGNHTVCETLHRTNFYPGGLAEYIRVPQINVEKGTFVLPKEISFAEGTLIEPLACVVRAQRMVGLKPPQAILILGAGVSGLLHLLLAKIQGITRIIITDKVKYRLRAAKEFGANAVVDAKEDVPRRLRQINEGRLADLVVVCTSATSAFKQALASVDRAGTILCFAPTQPQVTIPLPINDFWRQSIKIMHSYGASPLDIMVAIELMRNPKLSLKDLITHKLRLDEVGQGFRLVALGGQCLKVVIEPHRI